MVREVLSEYPYLLMSTELWPGDCTNKLERMNMNVDEENWKAVFTVNRRAQKDRRFSSNKFCKNTG